MYVACFNLAGKKKCKKAFIEDIILQQGFVWSGHLVTQPIYYCLIPRGDKTCNWCFLAAFRRALRAPPSLLYVTFQ